MTTLSNVRSLVFDIKVESADSTVRRNIASIRSGLAQSNGYIDQNSFIVPAGGNVSIPDVPMCYRLFIYSSQPLVIVGTPPSNAQVTFSGQSVLALDGGLSGVVLTNTGIIDANATLIRLATTNTSSGGTLPPPYAINPTLLSFPAFSYLVPIGASVTNLAKVVVTDTSYTPLVNDQIDPPSATIGQAYRICDSLGNPNSTGNYLMYLNQAVTSINSSGLLKHWIYQTT